MGYGEKVKKWFFDEDGDGEDIAEDYDAVEVVWFLHFNEC